MATTKILGSTYYLSNSTYLRVTDPENAYTDTDSTTYATITNSQSGTTTYYYYIRGFDFSQIPANAVVSGFTIRLKARESGINTSSSYSPKLCHGTSQLTSTCAAITTTATVREFSGYSLDWEDLVAYGDDFGIRINCRRASRNTTGYMYVYGAEIEVTYTVPNPRTLDVSLSGNGTVTPSGTSTVYDDDEVEIVITPADTSEQVSVTHNGADVSGQLVAHGAGQTISEAPSNHVTSGIQSGSSYAAYAVGHTAESPSTSGTSSNMYASSGSIGYADYSFDFSQVPAGATIEEVAVRCYGHRENANIDSTHVSQCRLMVGGSQESEVVDFPSTSNSVISLEPGRALTRAELDALTVRHSVGYYGGLVLGITVEVTYSVGSGVDHYTYTFTVSGDAAIVVTIGGSSSAVLWDKNNSTWAAVTAVWEKSGGVWSQVSDLTTLKGRRFFRQ